jgi:hypothetical protein
MKSMVYALMSSTRYELLNHILVAFAHIRNDRLPLMRSATSQCASSGRSFGAITS